MSDRNERACTKCGSLTHHEDDCPASQITTIEVPQETVTEYQFFFLGSSHRYRDKEYAERELSSHQYNYTQKAGDYFIYEHLYGYIWALRYGKNHLIPAWQKDRFLQFENPKLIGRKPEYGTSVDNPTGDSKKIEDIGTEMIASITARLARKFGATVRWHFEAESVTVEILSESATAMHTNAKSSGDIRWKFCDWSDSRGMGFALKAATIDFLSKVTGLPTPDWTYFTWPSMRTK